VAWHPDRDQWIRAGELAEAALDPSAVPQADLRPAGWTFVARTVWPQTAAVLLLRHASPSHIGFFGAGFVRHSRGWDLRIEHADGWPGEGLERPDGREAWSLHGSWAADVYLFVGQAAAHVASVRATLGAHAHTARPQARSGAFVLAGLVPTGGMALEALDAHGTVLDRHETGHV
jgi:hypothetical protein